MRIYSVLALIYCFVQGGSMAAQEMEDFILMSSAFSNNDMIPSQYTCDGQNISPALQWLHAPAGTKSFALIVDDPDAPKKVWVHWIVFNIPSKITQLSENVKTDNFLLGATDFNGAQKYGGPCPPSGIHHYYFTLYALDTLLDLPAGTNKEALVKAMEGHILGKAQLIGTYQRKK